LVQAETSSSSNRFPAARSASQESPATERPLSEELLQMLSEVGKLDWVQSSPEDHRKSPAVLPGCPEASSPKNGSSGAEKDVTFFATTTSQAVARRSSKAQRPGSFQARALPLLRSIAEKLQGIEQQQKPGKPQQLQQQHQQQQEQQQQQQLQQQEDQRRLSRGKEPGTPRGGQSPSVAMPFQGPCDTLVLSGRTTSKPFTNPANEIQ